MAATSHFFGASVTFKKSAVAPSWIGCQADENTRKKNYYHDKKYVKIVREDIKRREEKKKGVRISEDDTVLSL